MRRSRPPTTAGSTKETMSTLAMNQPRRMGRLELTGVAWLYLLLAIPAVALFVLEATFIGLTLLTIGLFALLAIVPMVAAMATAHRRLAEAVLGEPVPVSYRPRTGPGILGTLTAWVRD